MKYAKTLFESRDNIKNSPRFKRWTFTVLIDMNEDFLVCVFDAVDSADRTRS